MKISRMPIWCTAVAVPMVMLMVGGAFGQDDGDELDWPRKITTEKGEIVIYQPQVETFVGDKLESRSAISVKEAGQDGMIFGAMWFESRLVTDMETRMATLASTKVTAAKFPDVEQDRVDELLAKYQPSGMSGDVKKELRDITTRAASKAGMKKLPSLPKD